MHTPQSRGIELARMGADFASKGCAPQPGWSRQHGGRWQVNSGLSTPSTSMTSGASRPPAHHGSVLYVPVSGSRCPGWNRMIAS
jgi:hypothetical protein